MGRNCHLYLTTTLYLQDDSDDSDDDDDDEDLQSGNVAPEYKSLIAIHAGKGKGGLDDWLKVDPDKVRRLSLSEHELEKAAETHGPQIVRYSIVLTRVIQSVNDRNSYPCF